MTGLSAHDQTLTILGLARCGLRLIDADTRQQLIDARRDQQALMGDLSRSDLEHITAGLGTIAAGLADTLCEYTADDPEELLKRLVHPVVDAAADAGDDEEGE